MLEAAWWGFVGGAALLVGALLGLYLKVGLRVIGLVMAFGAGVLISAVAFELTEEAYQSAGGTAAALGLAAGALTFFTGDWLIDRQGGHRRKSPVHGGRAERRHRRRSGLGSEGGRPAPPRRAAWRLVLGALLDGIPESAAIGISLLGGGGVGVAMVAAVFLSNIPESMSATTGLKASGRSTGWILGLWALVVAASTVASVLGYALLGGASEETVAFIQTFAAGAILTMLADTMMPEAVEHAGRLVGLLTVLGFAVAFFLSSAPPEPAPAPGSGHLGGAAVGGLHRLAGRVPGPHPAGHVGHLVALLGQPGHHPLHPAARPAGDDQRLVGVEEGRELVDPRGQLGHRDVHRRGRVPPVPLLLLADVEHDRVVGQVGHGHVGELAHPSSMPNDRRPDPRPDGLLEELAACAGRRAACPPVWQVAQYCSEESANDTSRTTSPHSGQVSPVRPCTRMPARLASLSSLAGFPDAAATAAASVPRSAA